PLGINGALKFPCSLVAPERTSIPVFSLRSTTLALGTADPEASFTATVIVPVSSCAINGRQMAIRKRKAWTFLFIGQPTQKMFRRPQMETTVSIRLVDDLFQDREIAWIPCLGDDVKLATILAKHGVMNVVEELQP